MRFIKAFPPNILQYYSAEYEKLKKASTKGGLGSKEAIQLSELNEILDSAGSFI